jgi:hypothetical protein
MGNKYVVFADECAAELPGAVYSYGSQAFTVNGTTTPYMPVLAPGQYNLQGVLVEAAVTYTFSANVAANGTPNTLGAAMQGFDVVASAGGTPRMRTVTLAECQELERIFLGPNTSAVFAYPRPTIGGNGGGSTTRTDYVTYFIPCAGGQGVQVRFTTANPTYAFGSSATATVQFNLYAVPTLSNWVAQAVGLVTPPQPQQLVDFAQYAPTSLAIDYLDLPGTIASSTGATVNRAIIEGKGGFNTVDFENYPSLLAAQSVFPAAPSANVANLILNMKGQSATRLQLNLQAAFASGLDMLFTELTGGQSTTPANQPTATATKPLSTVTAKKGTGGIVVPSSGS